MAKKKKADSLHKSLPHDSVSAADENASALDKLNSQYDINSVVALYSSLHSHDDNWTRASLLLLLRSWVTSLCDFDPVTGESLPTSITDLINKLGKSNRILTADGEIRDRVFRIVSHTNEAIRAIVDHTRKLIIREHNLVPIYAAREVDINSIQWLSRKPGRTLREKLSGKPYVKAVQRKSSVDSSENRLFKACMELLEQTLLLRQSSVQLLPEDVCEDQLISIQRWLRSDDASEIGYWTNLPPNNALLQDKRYRKIWDAWLWLQDIDKKISGDNQRLAQDYLHVIFWSVLSLLNQSGKFRLIQQPVIVDWDEFRILPAMKVEGCIITDNNLLCGQVIYIDLNKQWGKLNTADNNELFFHKRGLGASLKIDALKVGDRISYDLGKNEKGDCAINIRLIQEIRYYNFEISDKTFRIKDDINELIIEASLDSMIMRTCPETNINGYGYSHSELNNIVYKTMSLLRIDPFSRSSADQAIEEQNWDESTLDLCSIRPLFTNTQGSQVPLSERLLVQYWPNSELIDCGSSNAIMLGKDIVSISMRSLFFYQNELSTNQVNSAAMQFAQTLNKSIQADRLTYLIPDSLSEFDWESVRRAVNFYYPEATPLPKSIATIFAWHTSKRFAKDEVRDNDVVLVIDHSDEGIIVTPIQAVFNQKLLEVLPESGGITWDRHPSYIIHDKLIYGNMVNNLSNNHCEQANELLKLFGFNGLVSDAGALSIVNDEKWYHLPKSLHEILTKNLDNHTLTPNDVSKCLKSISKLSKSNSVFILPNEDTIRKPEDLYSYKWLGSAWSPIKGSLSLIKWQSHAEGIALWRDHLPELSIEIVVDGHFENFYLVKDATVAPQRGNKVIIPIKETFILPAGQPHYSFPLQQGEGKRKLQFMAYLKSPSFPLKEGTSCKLHMTYTYGVDDPYELTFIPINTIDAEIKPIHVEWRSSSLITPAETNSLVSPAFPTPKTWNDFQHYPRKDCKTYTNLMDWCVLKLASLDNQIVIDPKGFINQIMDHRKTGYFEWGKYDKTNKYYCRVNVDGDSVFCHSSNFYEEVDFDTLYQGLPVYLDVIETSNGYKGIDITVSEIMPIDLLDRYSAYIKSEIATVRKAIYDIRFPVITMWNNGHTLAEPGVPENFRCIMLQRIEQAQSLIKGDSISDELKDELFFFLSCLHKDAPIVVSEQLEKVVFNEKQLLKYNRNIAYAIGTAELQWQVNLFSYAIEPHTKDGLVLYITLEILALVLWRSINLVYRITADELASINQRLLSSLRYYLRCYKNENKYQDLNKLCKLLELLLALLRMRGMENDKISSILSPNSELARELVNIVDDLSKVIGERNIKIRTRISLLLDKPSSFKNTPDLLYALRMYLTGDSGASAISINQIIDDE